jgi:unspecific monooxygenase
VSTHETRRPPGPRGRWAVGNSADYDADRVGFLRRCQAEYGDVFSFSPRTVFVGDPELVHELLEKANEEYVVESPIFGRRRSGERLDRDIEGWMCTRKRGSAAMSRAVTKAHGRRIIEAFDATLRESGGRDFDVWSVLLGYGGRAVADFLFGPGAEDLVAATQYRSHLISTFLNTSLTVPRWLPVPSVRRAVRADESVLRAIVARVDERIAHPHAQPEDMLDLLLAAPHADADSDSDSDRGATVDADVVPSRDEIIRALKVNTLASVGSPGTALSWILCEMSRDPQALRRLHDEAWQTIEATGSVLTDRNLTYSKAFVREILRLYPPTWLMGRTVHRACTLGGWPLRPGQEVMFSPYLLQRDARWWPEPERFLPERWLGRAAPDSRRAYIPFGSGPRMCMGLHVSLYQLVTATSHLAAHYRIESNAAEIEPFHHAMVVPRGLRARVTRLDETRPSAADADAAKTGALARVTS